MDAQPSSAITHSYTYTDNAPLRGINYYRLKMDDIDGKFTYSKVVRIDQPDHYKTIIAPNPVSDHTTVSFNLLQKQKTFISIYDAAGRLVKILVNAELQAGRHELSCNAKDKKGNNITAGIYFLRIETKDYAETKKIIFER